MSSLLFVFQLFNQIFNHLLFVFCVEPPQREDLNGSRRVAVCGELVPSHNFQHLALRVQRLAVEAEVAWRRDDQRRFPKTVTPRAHLLLGQPVVNSLDSVDPVVGGELQLSQSELVLQLEHGLELTGLLGLLLNLSVQVSRTFEGNLLGLANLLDLSQVETLQKRKVVAFNTANALKQGFELQNKYTEQGAFLRREYPSLARLRGSG